ncbi:MAG: heavy-metal-associated domain-containing protein [Thiohalomonadaceae bacterium]|jgi:copper chaperone CopZ
MSTEEFMVKNVKCGGCVANIQNGLKNMPGISAVEVGLDGKVTLQVDDLDRATIAAKLAELGYPVA